MKTGTILLLAGVGLAAYYFEQLGVAGDTVQILFNGVNIKSINDFQVSLLIQNVSNASLSVNAVTAQLSVNDNTIGNASYFGNPIIVPARGQVNVPIDFTPGFGLPLVIQQIVQGGGQLDFALEGNANINSLVLPFELEKSISLT